MNGIDQSGKLKAFYDASCVHADTLFTLFDEGDIRLGLLRNKDGIAYCSKYYSLKQTDNQVNRDDPFVFRLSEMYMNAAEAAWHLKDYTAASGYLKSILERAVDTDYAVNTLSQYSDAKLILLIEKERVKELCFRDITSLTLYAGSRILNVRKIRILQWKRSFILVIILYCLFRK